MSWNDDASSPRPTTRVLVYLVGAAQASVPFGLYLPSTSTGVPPVSTYLKRYPPGMNWKRHPTGRTWNLEGPERCKLTHCRELGARAPTESIFHHIESHLVEVVCHHRI